MFISHFPSYSFSFSSMTSLPKLKSHTKCPSLKSEKKYIWFTWKLLLSLPEFCCGNLECTRRLAQSTPTNKDSGHHSDTIRHLFHLSNLDGRAPQWLTMQTQRSRAQPGLNTASTSFCLRAVEKPIQISIISNQCLVSLHLVSGSTWTVLRVMLFITIDLCYTYIKK